MPPCHSIYAMLGVHHLATMHSCRLMCHTSAVAAFLFYPQNIGLLSPSQLTTFSPIFLNKDTLPGFQDMLDDGTILFSLNPCMSQFRGFSNIRVRKVGGLCAQSRLLWRGRGLGQPDCLQVPILLPPRVWFHHAKQPHDNMAAGAFACMLWL